MIRPSSSTIALFKSNYVHQFKDQINMIFHEEQEYHCLGWEIYLKMVFDPNWKIEPPAANTYTEMLKTLGYCYLQEPSSGYSSHGVFSYFFIFFWKSVFDLFL